MTIRLSIFKCTVYHSNKSIHTTAAILKHFQLPYWHIKSTYSSKYNSVIQSPTRKSFSKCLFMYSTRPYNSLSIFHALVLLSFCIFFWSVKWKVYLYTAKWNQDLRETISICIQNKESSIIPIKAKKEKSNAKHFYFGIILFCQCLKQ